MGFDLTGINAKNKKGEYFRNNCWYWRPLWDFATNVTMDLKNPQKLEHKGFTNDGYKVNKTEHKALVKGLKWAIETHELGQKADVVERTALKDCLRGVGEKNYPFEWGNVKEFLEFLENNEGFEIW